MAEINRESPVRFGVEALESERRDNWTVALAYPDEGPGPWLVDLAHKIRWDLQDSKVGERTPCDRIVPTSPGACTFDGSILINRMNRTQVSIYHLGMGASEMPDFPGFTDVSESTLFLALFGRQAFQVAEKLTNLDFQDPAKQAPFLLQGPFCHIPSQIVTLEKADGGGGGFLLTCSRGYGDSMVHALLKAGAEFDLRPAGENRFCSWLESLQA
jgi:hypothetical protein